MGSFNVACSVSSVSISSGRDVAFIPLLPRTRKYKMPHVVGAHSSLIYPHCYFNPFSLPIMGKYNDYGSVEKVVKNANTEAIEAFFGIPIESFLQCIGDKREFTDSVGEIFKHFSTHKELIGSYKTLFDESFLEQLGFQKNDENAYQCADHPVSVSLFESNSQHARGNMSYALRNLKTDEIVYTTGSSYGEVKSFLKQYYKFTDFMLNIEPDKQHLVELLSEMSGMFILKSIYDELALYHKTTESCAINGYLDALFLLSNGFVPVTEEEQPLIDDHHEFLWRKPGFSWDVKIGDYGSVLLPSEYKEYCLVSEHQAGLLKKNWEKFTKTSPEDTFPTPLDPKNMTSVEWNNVKATFKELAGFEIGSRWGAGYECKWNIYSISSFIKMWKEATGEVLSAGDLVNLTQHEVEYDSFRQWCLNYNENIAKIKSSTELSKDERIDELMFLEYKNPFNFSGSKKESKFLDSFKDWDFFEPLYTQAILQGELRKDFSDYLDFYFSMYSCNRFFFPAMNGEQYGNHRASLALCKATLAHLEAELKEFEEEEE